MIVDTMKKYGTHEFSLLIVESSNHGISFRSQALATNNREEIILPSLEIEINSSIESLSSRYKDLASKTITAAEKYLRKLANNGNLSRTIIVLGHKFDPFKAFNSRFDLSIKFLELLKRYQPAQIFIQTRSPLLVISMPILRELKKRLIVSIALETCEPEMVAKYSPNLPKIVDRLQMISVLRRFLIPIHLQISPILPYGDISKDAPKFANLINEHSDYVSCNFKAHPEIIRDKLAAERNFSWLREDANKSLELLLKKICPDKFALPFPKLSQEEQLSIFAA